MAAEDHVLIAGAGPVGLTTAANLVRNGVPVTMFEAGHDLSEESRASTFHPPTLDMLDALGAAQPLIAQGLRAPNFQYRSKQHGILAQFDFGVLADTTAHPYRIQCEQSKLTRILRNLLRDNSAFDLQFHARFMGVSQSDSGIASYEIAHVTLYKVHQRVARSFQSGRVFLAGDAAHINNPLGGMGMNGGIHDAINLTDRIAEVWGGEKPESELMRYDRQRRSV